MKIMQRIVVIITFNRIRDLCHAVMMNWRYFNPLKTMQQGYEVKRTTGQRDITQ